MKSQRGGDTNSWNGFFKCIIGGVCLLISLTAIAADENFHINLQGVGQGNCKDNISVSSEVYIVAQEQWIEGLVTGLSLQWANHPGPRPLHITDRDEIRKLAENFCQRHPNEKYGLAVLQAVYSNDETKK